MFDSVQAQLTKPVAFGEAASFFDVEQNERLKELDGQMAGEQYRIIEAAQGGGRSARLRKRTEPFRKAERQLEDLLGMVELGQLRTKHPATLAEEIATDAATLVATFDELELQAMLNDPNDKFGAVLSINAGAAQVVTGRSFCACTSAGPGAIG